MIFYNAEKALVFSWCPDWDLSALQGILSKRTDEVVRICFMTTQVYRIYLVSTPEGLCYWPYIYSNNAWRLLHRHLWKIRDVALDSLSSKEGVYKALEFQMVLQFRDSIEGYFTNLPTAEQITASLGDDPTLGLLDYYRYTYYGADVQEDDEWDGAVEVHCDGGSLLLPYFEAEDGEKHIIAEYATYVPDGVVSNLVRKVTSIFDSAISAVQNVHWSNLRLRVEKRWR